MAAQKYPPHKKKKQKKKKKKRLMILFFPHPQYLVLLKIILHVYYRYLIVNVIFHTWVLECFSFYVAVCKNIPNCLPGHKVCGGGSIYNSRCTLCADPYYLYSGGWNGGCKSE